MFDADRALELARAAGGALEGGLLRIVFAEQRLLGVRTEVIEIAAHAQDDFFRIEQLAGIRSRAVLRTATALDARVGLQRHNLCHVFAGDKAEVFVAVERRDMAEVTTGKKDG